MRVLLLSAYDASSHVNWRLALQAMFPRWQWRSLSLPPRHFSWRVRGNPLYWSLERRSELEAEYDLLLATSMVDLATLRGLVPALARLPSLLYFHENQFEYPRGRQRHSPVEAQMVSLYSALAADRVAFNSAYNRDTFLAGCEALLARLPDKVPPGVVPLLSRKSTVLPVPSEGGDGVPEQGVGPWAEGTRFPERPLRLLWVGRFEYDKGGDRLLHLLRQLEGRGLNFELAVAGQQFRNSPAAFGCIERDFAHRLAQFGYLPSPADLYRLMRGADLIVSTAIHEFQGLAVLEAVGRGCLPVVPDRLVYPEIYGEQYRYDSHLEDPLQEAESAAALVLLLAGQLAQGLVTAPDVTRFGRRALHSGYEALLQETARPGRPAEGEAVDGG